MELTNMMKDLIEEARGEMHDRYKQNLFECRYSIAKASEDIKELGARKGILPAKTNVLQILKEHEGSEVVVTMSNGRAKKDTYVLSGKTHIGFDGSYYPIISDNNNGITQVRDAKTDEVLYENPFKNYGFVIQTGYILGYDAALEMAEDNEKFALKDYETIQQKYAKAVENFEQKEKRLPKVLDRFLPLIPEQRFNAFANSFIRDYFSLPEIYTENTIKLMEELKKGTEIKEVAKLAEEYKGEYGAVVYYKNLIGKYSPRGEEFLGATKVSTFGGDGTGME